MKNWFWYVSSTATAECGPVTSICFKLNIFIKVYNSKQNQSNKSGLICAKLSSALVVWWYWHVKWTLSIANECFSILINIIIGQEWVRVFLGKSLILLKHILFTNVVIQEWKYSLKVYILVLSYLRERYQIKSFLSRHLFNFNNLNGQGLNSLFLKSLSCFVVFAVTPQQVSLKKYKSVLELELGRCKTI